MSHRLKPISARRRSVAAGLLALALLSASTVARPALGNDAATTYVVVFHSHASLPEDADALIRNAGGVVVERLTQVGTVVAASSDPGFEAAIGAKSGVVAVSEDKAVQLDMNLEKGVAADGPAEPAGADPQPGPDPLYSQQWDKMRMNASSTGSYAVQRGRPEVEVAVIDSGIEVTHADVAPNLDLARSRSFVEGEPDVDDDFGHGTFVASQIAAPINGFGLSGVAPDVTLVAVKVLNSSGGGSIVDIAEGVIYAGKSGFDVANMSLGIYLDRIESQGLIMLMQRAVGFTRSRGVTVVAALHNQNRDLGDGDLNHDVMMVPAELSGVIGVSATGYLNQKTFYSNYGAGVTDVSAPGGVRRFQPVPPSIRGRGAVLGAWAPEGIAPIPLIDLERHCRPSGDCHFYIWQVGTSWSTANASGVAALIISEHGDFSSDDVRKPHLSPTAVESILQKTANNQPCPNPRSFTYPPPIPPSFASASATCLGSAGYNGFFGKGIVDALKAVSS